MRPQCRNCERYSLGIIAVGASGKPLDWPVLICPGCDYAEGDAGPPAGLENRVKDVTS